MGAGREIASRCEGLSNEAIEALVREQIDTVVADQVAAGLDIVSEGEVTRRDYWSYFVSGLHGVTIGQQPGSPVPVVQIVDELKANFTCMIDDWRTAQSFTDRPVKVTIPGPLTCATYVQDAYYPSPEARSLALTESFRNIFIC